MALPGDYQVRLTMGSWADTKPFKLLMDPRVEADGITMADLRAQFEFNMTVAELSVEANALRSALDDALGSGDYSGGDLEELQAIHGLMVDAGGSYPQPVFLSQLRYLQGMTGRADQRPGNFAYSRYEELSQEFGELKQRFDAVVGGGE